MERIVINAESRAEAGKGAARSLRREGAIPGVLYRAGNSLPIKINRKELLRFIKSTSGEQVLVNLKFASGSDKLALMKEYQTDPVTGELLHIDFFEVSLEEKIKVTLHVATAGEPIGVKRDGGLLQHGLRDIEIECLPDKIVGRIDLDVSGLAVGQSIHVRDLKLGEGIRILTDLHEVIATVTAPIVEEVVAPEAAAAAVAEEKVEPEVIKKGKKEEAEA